MKRGFTMLSIAYDGRFEYKVQEEAKKSVTWHVHFMPNSGYKHSTGNDIEIVSCKIATHKRIHGIFMETQSVKPSRKMKLAISGTHTVFDVELEDYQLTGAVPINHWSATNIQSGQVIKIQAEDTCTRFDLTSILAKAYDGRSSP